MLTDEELDKLEENWEGLLRGKLCSAIERLIAQARELNRLRRDHEAMNVLRSSGGRSAANYAFAILDDPADAILAWRDKYQKQETSDG